MPSPNTEPATTDGCFVHGASQRYATAPRLERSSSLGSRVANILSAFYGEAWVLISLHPRLTDPNLAYNVLLWTIKATPPPFVLCFLAGAYSQHDANGVGECTLFLGFVAVLLAMVSYLRSPHEFQGFVRFANAESPSRSIPLPRA